MKRNFFALSPFFLLFTLFLWPLLLLKKGFVLYDYQAQHLPWAWHYFQSLQSGKLPYWTNQMTCGFPLMAEGQIGCFYILNFLSYKFMPFLAAYVWSVPLHMLIGGIGMYAYGRTIGLSRAAASMATVCFEFGSGFGGCFYNTGSLRVLSWLPVSLLILEKMRKDKGEGKLFLFCLLSIVFSQAWTAGFSQIAVYLFLYALAHEFFASQGKPKLFFLTAAAVILGTLLSLVQIVPTIELIGRSIRHGESASFALWGSVPPPALVSLLFPQWGNALRVSFYIGALPFLMVLASFGFPKNDLIRRHVWLAALFFLMALGRFNPVYRWFIESFSLTFMRNPSKFLFFAGTSLSVLAGCGLDRTLRAREMKESHHFYIKILKSTAIFALTLPLLGQVARALTQGLWPKFSRWYAAKLIVEKGAAAKPASYYLQTMDDFFKGLSGLFSYLNPFNLAAIAFTVTGFLGIRAFLKQGLNKNLFIDFTFLFLVCDLFIFGNFLGTGFIGNAGDLSRLKESGVAQFGEPPGHENFSPNAQMLYGLSSPGGYSPLLLKNYYELVYELGIVDGSLGRAAFSPEMWKKEGPLLDVIGAKPKIVGFYDWKALPDKKERLAFLKGPFFDSQHAAVLSEEAVLKPDPLFKNAAPAFGEITQSSETDLHAGITLKTDAVVFVRIAGYPGWNLSVDGRPEKWFFVDHAFLGFAASKGFHSISLNYVPTHWKFLKGLTIFLWGFVLLLMTARILRKENFIHFVIAFWVLAVFLFYFLWVIFPKLREVF